MTISLYLCQNAKYYSFISRLDNDTAPPPTLFSQTRTAATGKSGKDDRHTSRSLNLPRHARQALTVVLRCSSYYSTALWWYQSPPSGPISCQSFSLHHVDVTSLEVNPQL